MAPDLLSTIPVLEAPASQLAAAAIQVTATYQAAALYLVLLFLVILVRLV